MDIKLSKISTKLKENSTTLVYTIDNFRCIETMLCNVKSGLVIVCPLYNK